MVSTSFDLLPYELAGDHGKLDLARNRLARVRVVEHGASCVEICAAVAGK